MLEEYVSCAKPSKNHHGKGKASSNEIRINARGPKTERQQKTTRSNPPAKKPGSKIEKSSFYYQ